MSQFTSLLVKLLRVGSSVASKTTGNVLSVGAPELLPSIKKSEIRMKLFEKIIKYPYFHRNFHNKCQFVLHYLIMVFLRWGKRLVHREYFCDLNGIIGNCIGIQLEVLGINMSGTGIHFRFHKLDDKLIHLLPKRFNLLGGVLIYFVGFEWLIRQ